MLERLSASQPDRLGAAPRLLGLLLRRRQRLLALSLESAACAFAASSSSCRFSASEPALLAADLAFFSLSFISRSFFSAFFSTTCTVSTRVTTLMARTWSGFTPFFTSRSI